MKRKLISQMLRQWGDNIWLVAGLTIVTLTIWYFAASLYTLTIAYFTPLGYDYEEVYVMPIGMHREGSPSFVQVDGNQETVHDSDLKEIMRRIRSNPNVVAAGFSNNGMPFNLTLIGNNIRLLYPHPDSLSYMGNTRQISPDIAKVLKLQSRTGKDFDYLQRRLEAGEILVSHIDPEKIKENREYYRFAEELKGEIICNWDTTKGYRVADVINKMRRFSYEDIPDIGDVVYPYDESKILEDVGEIAVRVKPGRGKAFEDDFRNTPELRSQRNTYLKSGVKLSQMRKSIERKNDMKARTYLVVIGFMVIIIFIGLLGTFWFRVQQRTGEIAIRRVCGASRGSIFRRLIGEGAVLLVVATLVAAGVGWFLAFKLNYFENYTVRELLLLEMATFIVAIIGIALSIVAPAWLAMRIEPARAVKDE